MDIQIFFKLFDKEAQWASGRVSDSGARGQGFDPHSGRLVVSLSKIHLPPKSTGNTQEGVAHPNMTEKLFTGTLSENKTKNYEII